MTLQLGALRNPLLAAEATSPYSTAAVESDDRFRALDCARQVGRFSSAGRALFFSTFADFVGDDGSVMAARRFRKRLIHCSAMRHAATRSVLSRPTRRRRNPERRAPTISACAAADVSVSSTVATGNR